MKECAGQELGSRSLGSLGSTSLGNLYLEVVVASCGGAYVILASLLNLDGGDVQAVLDAALSGGVNNAAVCVVEVNLSAVATAYPPNGESCRTVCGKLDSILYQCALNLGLAAHVESLGCGITVCEVLVAENNKAPEKPVKYKQSKLIPTVIITADYEMPRVFAQTARRDLNIPYIMILSNAKDPEAELVFMAPKATKAVSLKAKDLSKLLAYLRARDVIILGNTEYVPAFYSLAIPKTSRKVVIADTDWQVNAVKLSNVLNSGKIFDAYLKYEAARKADLEQKRAAYKKAELEKAAAIEKARQLKSEVIEAEAN